MDQRKLLLLHLCLCFDVKGTLVKTISREPDITPICAAATLSTIVLIVCKIRTERSGGEECRLLYRYGEDFVHECDSRYALMEKNRTVFLNLTRLTPEDTGDYTCECSHAHGTETLHLVITVEGEEAAGSFPVSHAVIGRAAAVLIMTGVLLGLILKNVIAGQRCSR
ncbi:uncharacterized protein LOC131962664 isoform X2 [Centropristis striata]|uniref:uncharacterized protein LOC131962664 isoform X2 n=1 Tax=Centropristis striata TaxID=184440 RepID=UPI0027DF86BB|nr:uncharacterized protein LOC131962664 isoform X2 [Centropristis striata]